MVYLSCSFLKKMVKTSKNISHIGVIGLEKGYGRIQDVHPSGFSNVSYHSGKKTNTCDTKKGNEYKETTRFERKRVSGTHNSNERELPQIILSLYQMSISVRNVGIKGSMIDSRFPILFNSFLISSISLNICNEDNLVSPHVIILEK